MRKNNTNISGFWIVERGMVINLSVQYSGFLTDSEVRQIRFYRL